MGCTSFIREFTSESKAAIEESKPFLFILCQIQPLLRSHWAQTELASQLLVPVPHDSTPNLPVSKSNLCKQQLLEGIYW
ncbi:hypothetical protein EB796_009965 [Bugula neritina]|uniref:Uncharacterized protein n=1 Tax=Bugula neritina TaxID=10212 RepID=A0A7J7K0M2_BUGNE|nr:hypothetical protein EB796_009965 [Bugula neritina]